MDCNGEKCKDCKFCRKNGFKLLQNDIEAQKWRLGLSIAILCVFIASVVMDAVMLYKIAGG